MRWKLAAVGGLGAIALGLSAPSTNSAGLVICLAPFLSVYCDLLCREYDLRVAIIAAYFRKEGSSFAKYEIFVNSEDLARTKWWKLKNTTLYGPTIATCVITVAIGYFLAQRFDTLTFKLSLAVALIGLLLLICIQCWFDSKQKPIGKIGGAASTS